MQFEQETDLREWRKHILYSLKRTSLGESAHCYSLWLPGSIWVTWRRTTHISIHATFRIQTAFSIKFFLWRKQWGEKAPPWSGSIHCHTKLWVPKSDGIDRRTPAKCCKQVPVSEGPVRTEVMKAPTRLRVHTPLFCKGQPRSSHLFLKKTSGKKLILDQKVGQM